MSEENDRFPKNPEKRHYKRIDLELPVEILFEGNKVAATTENVSCGGMYLPNIDADFSASKDIIAIVNLPDRAAAIRLSAKVARIEEGETKKQGVALEFDGLYDDNRLEMDRYIKWKLLN